MTSPRALRDQMTFHLARRVEDVLDAALETASSAAQPAVA